MLFARKKAGNLPNPSPFSSLLPIFLYIQNPVCGPDCRHALLRLPGGRARWIDRFWAGLACGTGGLDRVGRFPMLKFKNFYLDSLIFWLWLRSGQSILTSLRLFSARYQVSLYISSHITVLADCNIFIRLAPNVAICPGSAKIGQKGRLAVPDGQKRREINIAKLLIRSNLVESIIFNTSQSTEMQRTKFQTRSQGPSSEATEMNLLHSIIGQVGTKQECEKILAEASKKYQIKQYNIQGLGVEKVLQIYQNLRNKCYAEQISQDFHDQWYDNELRLFIWLFICYTHLYRKSLEDMTRKQWAEFSDVFCGKTPFLFEYQAKIIKKVNKKSKKWSVQEDQCLSSIIRHFTTLLGSIQTYKWSEVAKKLFIESNRKFFRTPKQCRERWMNHLDPVKLKSKWTLGEDFTLIDYVLKEGKKWAMIAKAMGSIRTEHMVKNRYNSLLRAEMKKYDEMADQMRVMKKLQNRVKYSLENKAAEKESAGWKEKEQSESGELEGKGLNNCLEPQNNDHYIEAFDQMLETLKKQEPRLTCINLMQYEQDNLADPHNSNLQFEFEFKPSYPDYF